MERQSINGGESNFGELLANMEIAEYAAADYGSRAIAAIATARLMNQRGYSSRDVNSWVEIAKLAAKLAAGYARRAGHE